jgi:hypothetical protein
VVEADERTLTTDNFLDAIDQAGRALNDVPSGLDALDDMAKRSTRPTVGWMTSNTHMTVLPN